MIANTTSGKLAVRIAVFGPDGYHGDRRHGSGLWDAGIRACLEMAEAEAVMLPEKLESTSQPTWKKSSNIAANTRSPFLQSTGACMP